MDWPKYTEEEIQIASEILASGKVNYWTGEHGKAFEKEFAAHCQTEFAVACMNGTAALEMALKALEVGPGDEVIVTPRSFIASVSCVPWAGATPVFADVSHDSGNLYAGTIEPCITSKTKAIIAVHINGWPCEMDPILDLARKHNLYVIEDCAQAHGATYKGKPVGSMGDIGVYSFCQDKIMSTAGEGGMLVTNHRHFWKRAWSWKDHGKDYDTIFNKTHPPGFRWVHESIGTNARMPEIQAAIGRIQLKNLQTIHDCRTDIARQWWETAQKTALFRTPWPPDDSEGAFYRYPVYIQPERLASGWTRNRIIEEANQAGVPCMQGICSEIYKETAFENIGWRPQSPLPIAKELGETSITFLTHPTQQQEKLEKAQADFLKIAEAATGKMGL